MAQITHSQIAKIARISRSTVSRALQNHPAIPEKTRLRIQRLAEKLSYRPNPLISALMASRSKPRTTAFAIPIATLTAWPPSRDLAPIPSIQRLLRGASDRASELGYHLEEFWIDEPGMTGERLNQILVNRGIVAAMLAPLPDTHSEIQLDWEQFSIGTFAPNSKIPRFHRASHFHFNGACVALEELHRRGYRRPGMILYTESDQQVREQYLGGMAAVELRAIFKRKIPPLILNNGRIDLLESWLKRYEPDVVVSDESHTIKCLKNLGCHVPRDIAFAHLDRPPGNEYGGIDQLKELIGRSVIDLIVAQVNRNERGIPRYSNDIKLAGVWMDGRSVPSL